MIQDLPILIVEDEDGNVTCKEFKKAVNRSGKINVKTFYRLVKTFLLMSKLNKKLSLSFSPSLIYSDVDISDINNVLQKICDLYNTSNYFNNIVGTNIPIDIFFEFVNDRTDRTLLRVYNMQAIGKKEWASLEEEFGDKISSYSSGDVYYIDSKDSIVDTLFYLKMKYPDMNYDYKVYSMKNGILELL